MTTDVTPTPKKKRQKSDVIAIEKHYGEPLTEEEQDEIADLIASVIFNSLRETIDDKPTQ